MIESLSNARETIRTWPWVRTTASTVCGKSELSIPEKNIQLEYRPVDTPPLAVVSNGWKLTALRAPTTHCLGHLTFTPRLGKCRIQASLAVLPQSIMIEHSPSRTRALTLHLLFRENGFASPLVHTAHGRKTSLACPGSGRRPRSTQEIRGKAVLTPKYTESVTKALARDIKLKLVCSRSHYHTASKNDQFGCRPGGA